MAWASSEDSKLWHVSANAGLWSYNKTRSIFLFLTEKLLKKSLKQLPSTSYLKDYRSHLKNEETLKNDKGNLIQICMSQNPEVFRSQKIL